MATVEAAGKIDAVAIGSPHLSTDELIRSSSMFWPPETQNSLLCCTGRHALADIDRSGLRQRLEACGVTVVADTCVVVTPI